MAELKIGLFGYGNVGQGVYDILTDTVPQFQVQKICIKHPEKTRNIDASYFTTDPLELINDPEIDVIVEAIDDAVAAFEILKLANTAGKKVVTANKKMVAEHYLDIKALYEKSGHAILYEAASCASIPIIRLLETYYGYDLIEYIEGIYNGTTNYILTKLFIGAGTYKEILAEAQTLGYAESDPSLDVNGSDAKYKLCINMAHAYGLYVKPSDIYTYGIETIEPIDIDFAKRSGQKIILNAKAVSNNGDVSCWVMPTFIDEKSLVYGVEDVENCIKLCPSYADEQFYVGKGAGSYPTGSAVVADIFAVERGYPYPKWKQGLQPEHLDDVQVPIYIRYQYEEQVDDLKFVRVEQKTELNYSKYMTGIVNLADLKRSKVNEDSHVFIATFSR